MDGLRWILLIAGIFIVAGVFLYSRRNAGDDRPPSTEGESPGKVSRERVAPSLGLPEKDTDSPEESLPDDLPAPAVGEQLDIVDSLDDETDAGAAGAADIPQKIVTLRIVSGDKTSFNGDRLVLALRGIGMRHGRFGIFHQYDGDDENRVVFSAASLVEPGSFELENIREQRIPGISLFMVLPGPIDGAEAFDRMIEAARTVSQSLNAELLDESGSSLSIQRERYLREEIIQYQLENRLA